MWYTEYTDSMLDNDVANNKKIPHQILIFFKLNLSILTKWKQEKKLKTKAHLNWDLYTSWTWTHKNKFKHKNKQTRSISFLDYQYSNQYTIIFLF